MTITETGLRVQEILSPGVFDLVVSTYRRYDEHRDDQDAELRGALLEDFFSLARIVAEAHNDQINDTMIHSAAIDAIVAERYGI